MSAMNENPIKFVRGTCVSCSFVESEDVTKGVLRRNDGTDFCVVVPGDQTDVWEVGKATPSIPGMQKIGVNAGRDVYKRVVDIHTDSQTVKHNHKVLEPSTEDLILTALSLAVSYQSGEAPEVSLNSIKQLAAQWKALGYL